jgi:hypothetical protein
VKASDISHDQFFNDKHQAMTGKYLLWSSTRNRGSIMNNHDEEMMMPLSPNECDVVTISHIYSISQGLLMKKSKLLSSILGFFQPSSSPLQETIYEQITSDSHTSETMALIDLNGHAINTLVTQVHDRKKDDIKVSPIGLLNMLNVGGSVRDIEISKHGNEQKFQIIAVGELVFDALMMIL